MHILVAGGTGFIGRHLVQHLKLNGHKVTTVSRFSKKQDDPVITWQQLRFGEGPADATHLVNLSGNAWEGWNSYSDRAHLDAKGASTSAMEKFETSRISTAAVCRAYALERAEQGSPLECFIQGSAFWYYHSNEQTQTHVYSEHDLGGYQNLFSRHTKSWEKAALMPQGHETRQVIIRTGQVLEPSGGIMRKMRLQRGFMGTGRNPLNWIHMDDQIDLIYYALTNQHVDGVLNAIAPEQVNHRDLARRMSLKKSWLGERRALKWFGAARYRQWTGGAWVEPERTLDMGYHFKFNTLGINLLFELFRLSCRLV